MKDWWRKPTRGWDHFRLASLVLAPVLFALRAAPFVLCQMGTADWFWALKWRPVSQGGQWETEPQFEASKRCGVSQRGLAWKLCPGLPGQTGP